MKISKSIVIAALARDCALSIENNIPAIERLRTYFDESFVIIFENDSKDNTKEVLSDYKHQYNNVEILSQDFNGDYPFQFPDNAYRDSMSNKRIARMVYIRNLLLEHIKKHYNVDYVIFLDIDVQNFSVDGVIYALTHAPEDWGGLFANSFLNYKYNGRFKRDSLQYDSYAYMPYNSRVSDTKIYYVSPTYQLVRAYKINKLVNSQQYTKVKSAFGGIGLYKYEAIKDLNYSLVHPHGWEKYNMSLCEHTSVNEKISETYSNYIARAMEVTYGTICHKSFRGFIMYYFTLMQDIIGALKKDVRLFLKSKVHIILFFLISFAFNNLNASKIASFSCNGVKGVFAESDCVIYQPVCNVKEVSAESYLNIICQKMSTDKHHQS